MTKAGHVTPYGVPTLYYFIVAWDFRVMDRRVFSGIVNCIPYPSILVAGKNYVLLCGNKKYVHFFPALL